jgi:D-glycero-alpha-D-manno-heptose-7-phosphate kinase
MIVAKCPLRVSLVGGSTDLEQFLDKYKLGSVISFPSTLYTYITLVERYDKYYQINYTQTERVVNTSAINNDIAREVIKHFNLPPVTITFNADIPATGSGLASSSSYLVCLIQAASDFCQLDMSQADVCKLALEIERKFNPLTGYKDTYGCGIGDLKRLLFTKKDDKVTTIIKYLDSTELDKCNMYLIPTSVNRQSTDVLSTIDVTKSKILLNDVADLNHALDDHKDIHYILNKAWVNKKQTSPHILTDELKAVEDSIYQQCEVKSLKLCGAGGGGYFLVITPDELENGYKIKINKKGVESWKL